jgi:class 3 adenylate cyclase/tetratricopeptide (TPR) repeat protein
VTVCASCGHEAAEVFRFCPACGAPAVTAREHRKVVTVLFCDLVGSTALGAKVDPEALRMLLAQYFQTMKAIIERHGGTVEKFIGDAVMAVFGVPVLHEDDALRACRAAVEMRDALPALGFEGRIGVTTGEVVTGTEERLATGDAVNVAARLEQAAAPGEVLIGEPTFGLVGPAVDASPVEPVELKGKSQPVPAYRLHTVRAETGRRLDGPMVGREREQRMLADAWERTCSEGAAGVGKSRLTEEFLGSLGDATVLRGRCLSYGEGITYWPVVEVIKQLLGPEARESLPLFELDLEVTEAALTLLGEADVPTTPPETAWAVRKLLEAQAWRSPLVVVFDDIHWGEQTFLDLIEHIADLSRDAPILLLCMARPELLDRRAGWGGGKLNAATVLLEPLPPAETDRLIENLLGGASLDHALCARIRNGAEGNPLFVEEMLALVRAGGRAEVIVPPTIQALLAARIDQLDPSERDVLERGAVEGQVFHRGAVEALGAGDSRVRLSALVRKELIRPERAQLRGEDAYRFRHLLIRDAAYDALPKATRAELHERFADWLSGPGSGLVEEDELAGYHLEQAALFRSELGTPDPELAARASKLLGTAGLRASDRRDSVAAENLLERALELVPDDERDVELELELIDVLHERGRIDDHRALIEHVAAAARRRGDRLVELRARLNVNRVFFLPDKEVEALANEAVPLLAEAGDHAALARVWLAVTYLNLTFTLRYAEGIEAANRCLEQAQLAGDERLQLEAMERLLAGHFWGPTPVGEALSYADARPELARRLPEARASRAALEALVGRFSVARDLFADYCAAADERGSRVSRATRASQHGVMIELLAGEPETAVMVGREAYEELAEMGASGWQSTAAAFLAQASLAAGRPDEAERWSHLCEELGDPRDIFNEIIWRWTRGVAVARRGDLDQGERFARSALEVAHGIDILVERGDAHTGLATVLELAGRENEARAELEEALRLYDLKGATVLVDRTRAALAERVR